MSFKHFSILNTCRNRTRHSLQGTCSSLCYTYLSEPFLNCLFWQCEKCLIIRFVKVCLVWYFRLQELIYSPTSKHRATIRRSNCISSIALRHYIICNCTSVFSRRLEEILKLYIFSYAIINMILYLKDNA